MQLPNLTWKMEEKKSKFVSHDLLMTSQQWKPKENLILSLFDYLNVDNYFSLHGKSNFTFYAVSPYAYANFTEHL